MRQWAALVFFSSVHALCLLIGAVDNVEAICIHNGFTGASKAPLGYLNNYNDGPLGFKGIRSSLTLEERSSRWRSGRPGFLWKCSLQHMPKASSLVLNAVAPLQVDSTPFHKPPGAISGDNASNSVHNSCKRSFTLNSFFGSISNVFTDAEYDHRLAVNEKYAKITGETDDSGLPLAPENEEYEVEDSIPEGDSDLSKPPSSKEEWYLKRLARGRRFWHKYFADPSQQSLRFYRLVKMKHDMKYCNRIVRKDYTEIRPEIKQKIVDGKLQRLTREERNLNRSRIQVKRTLLGFDNTSADSNILILLTLPQARLVRMVERIRLPHLLALRNFEMLRLLRHSMLFMSKPNIFESTVDFLLTFSRLNNDYKGDIPLFCELPVKPAKRFRPMIYAVIGKPKNDPFADHLLKVRTSTPPPIREEFPRSVDNETSVISRFLDSCQSLTMQRLKHANYDFDAVMDRSFSDNFAEMMPSYNTHESVNRIDYPITVSYSTEMGTYLREPVPNPTEEQKGTTECGTIGIQNNAKQVADGNNAEKNDSSSPGSNDETALVQRGSSKPWTAEEVKLMLKRVYKLGLTKPSTLMKRIRDLHCDIGFSFEDILWIGREIPQVLRFGNYRQRCQQIYDCDESLTFQDILYMVRENPNLLVYNVMRCLRPKLYYFTRVMRKDIKDVVTFSKALTYSLYDRIIPRHLAIMNSVYKGEFLKVYRYLFESGFYKGYGQTITDPKVPDILPSDHGKYLDVYTSVSGRIDLRQMLTINDDEFIRHYELSYRELAQGKEDAIKIPLPTDLL